MTQLGLIIHKAFWPQVPPLLLMEIANIHVTVTYFLTEDW